ncbi:rho family-interacting cell polarization regulator 1-like isoform X2 [Synchiropus splendidus]|uniref:rho family-interacting cell polarization regulator 1-like isoform X2 n=1 Tax=Synchiropus splendidus TaxID=270530 RepID=UPI00237EB481|nr:rho family-interacting cell polarization regulator 1-like isoform X2 [Synchiropus splendidus]
MFTGSTKLPPAKTPQPERLDEVYAALRRGLQSYLQVHQLELDSLGQQIRENKRNGRLGSLYEQDKQVKAIERFMRRLEFHLSKVEELYDAYCIQRRVRDGASKMVAAFNSATGSREARESLSEANKGYRECTEHMCSLESELESHMGEFHVKMKGLAGFARLCAGDQYEVLMRYGRQRWRLRGRVEVSNKQVWDSEEYIFLPLVTELLSIKVTELKSLANHVVVGSVSCEMLDLFCPLPQTLAVDINDLGTVKLNLEVTWSPFDKDDQTSSTSTVSKRLLSNQSPPDTPSMREQVFYSLLKRQGELDNGTVWSNSSESSDDSSSPALAHPAQRLSASNLLQATLSTTQLSSTPRKSSASTPSLSSNQEEDESEVSEPLSQIDAVPNGHLQTSCSQVRERSPEHGATDRASVQSADLSETSELSCSSSEVLPAAPASLEEGADGPDSGTGPAEPCEAKLTAAESGNTVTAEGPESSQQELKPPDETVPFPTSTSFIQEVETALESFDFLNCSDLEDNDEEEEKEEEDEAQENDDDEEEKKEEEMKQVDEEDKEEDTEEEEKQEDEPEEKDTTVNEEEVKEEQEEEELIKDQSQIENMEEEENVKKFFCAESDDEEQEEGDGGGLEILMEAPEGFRNSDEDRFSESQESSVCDLEDLSQVELPDEEEEEEEQEEKCENAEERS